MTGVTNMNKKNSFNYYQIITEKNVIIDKSAYENDRKVQNVRDMYKAFQTYIIRDIKNKTFSKIMNVSSVDCGVSLLFHMAKLTM